MRIVGIVGRSVAMTLLVKQLGLLPRLLFAAEGTHQRNNKTRKDGELFHDKMGSGQERNGETIATGKAAGARGVSTTSNTPPAL